MTDLSSSSAVKVVTRALIDFLLEVHDGGDPEQVRTKIRADLSNRYEQRWGGEGYAGGMRITGTTGLIMKEIGARLTALHRDTVDLAPTTKAIADWKFARLVKGFEPGGAGPIYAVLMTPSFGTILATAGPLRPDEVRRAALTDGTFSADGGQPYNGDQYAFQGLTDAEIDLLDR